MERVLFVDDEEHVLSAFKREFRKEYDVWTASGPENGLKTGGKPEENPKKSVARKR